jgi:hypothetical protein
MNWMQGRFLLFGHVVIFDEIVHPHVICELAIRFSQWFVSGILNPNKCFTRIAIAIFDDFLSVWLEFEGQRRDVQSIKNAFSSFLI